MVDKYGTGSDVYTYSGTDVLINKFDIRDQKILDEAEREFSELSAAEITFQEPPYNFQYFCAVHRKLFGELFDWAGEIRTIDISKGTTRFCSSVFIEKEARKLFDNLERDNYLTSLNIGQFTSNLAQYYCDINVLHPFRDGNGRAQRIVFEHICINCGYNLNLSGVTVKQWRDANTLGYNGNYSGMGKIIENCLSTIKQ